VIWVLSAILGAFAVAMGRTVSFYQEEKAKTAVSESEPAQPAAEGVQPPDTPATPQATCDLPTRFCTMDYRPKTCTVLVEGVKYEASGNNGCQANEALLRELCSKGVTALSARQLETVACAEPAGESSN